MDPKTCHPRVVTAAAIVALVGASLGVGASPADAQDASERYKVLVANFAPQAGAKDNFGKDVAKELRKFINEMVTHQSYEGKDFRDALKKYGLKEEDLAEPQCIKARQLATQEGVQLVLCGAYTDAGAIESKIISPAANAIYEVPNFNSSDPKQSAERIATSFQNYTQALAQTVYCNDYIQSQQYQQALDNCEKALQIDGNSKAALYGKASVLYHLDRKPEALQTFQRVLDLDPLHQDALKFSGLISTELGNTAEGRKYFNEYLSLNPGDQAVRLTIAQDMAKAGDFEGALGVTEEGMKPGEDNIDLQAYAGGLAINAAEKRKREYAGASNELPAEARTLYQKALTYFEPVLTAKGDATDPAIVRNMLVAHQSLGNTAEATALGARATQLFPQDATLWQVYAMGLKEQGDLSGALAALDKAKAADPSAPVNKQKMVWLIEAGRIDDAAAPARAVVQNNEMPADEVVNFIAGNGWNQKGKNDQHREAIKYYELAAELAPTAQVRAMPNFFHGFALLKIGIEQQNPSTLESARASLPTFQRAKQLLEGAAGYQAQESTRQTLLSNVNDYIAIQEALIKRGR